MFIESRHRLLPISRQSKRFRSADHDLLDARRYREVFESLRRRVSARPALLLRDKPGAIGLRWLLGHEDLVTRRILKALVSPGFAFGVQRRVTIFPDKGRDIYVADWPDRIVLMLIARVLYERLEPILTDHVFSFRKGRSNWDALRQLRAFIRSVPLGRNVYVVRRDIHQYGDTIDQQQILDQVRTYLALDAKSLFARMIELGIRVVYQTDGVRETLQRGIPSGSPLCPPLENLYLHRLDRRLLACCQEMAPSGAFYGRYGDDFLLATDCEACAVKAREIIADTVDELGLTVSSAKSLDASLALAEQGFEWLGLRISRRGLYGCKRKRWRKIRRSLSIEMDRLVQMAFRANLPDAQRMEILREGIHSVLDPLRNPCLGPLIFEQDDSCALRDLDQVLSRDLAQKLGRQLGGGRHLGWRLLRKLGYPSLLHTRAERRWR